MSSADLVKPDAGGEFIFVGFQQDLTRLHLHERFRPEDAVVMMRLGKRVGPKARSIKDQDEATKERSPDVESA